MRSSQTTSMARRSPQRRVRPQRRVPAWAALLLCALLVAAACALSLLLGASTLSPGEILSSLLDPASTGARILLHVRLPRLCGTLLAGAALAAAGAILQSVLGNPIASPNVIGVNAGAGFAVALCTALAPTGAALLPAAAFLGALAAVLLVFFLARATGASRTTLILSGVALNSLLNAGTDTVTTLFPDVLVGSLSFRVGGVAGLTLERLAFPAVYIGVGLLAALLLSHDMDVLSLGDETARSLGLRVQATRFLLLGTAAALAGAAVSFAGLLGFVGLIVPHAARFLVGGEARRLLPASILLGVAFLTLCDVVARLLFAPYELPVGIVMSFLGCPFFLYLLIRRKGGHAHA